MFFDPLVLIQIDGGPILDYSKVRDISIYSSIDSTLPELTFKINDSDGRFISTMQLYLGQIVNVMVRDISSDGDKIAARDSHFKPLINLCTFTIKRIYDGLEAGNGYSGFIQVWCTQSWRTFGNYKPKIYSPQLNSNVIRDVCKNANKLANIGINADYWSESSDQGIIPRYKCGESDIEFLETKVLPYTNIDDSNVFFFLDQFGYAHLTSFDKIKNAEEKAIIRAPDSQVNDVWEKVNKLKDEKKIEAYPYEDIKIDIGDINILKKLGLIKQKVLIVNNNTGKVYDGIQKLSARMGGNSGKTFQNVVPVSLINMASMEATSSKIIENRIFDDAMAIAGNSEIQLEDMFQIIVSVGNIVNEVLPGDTINLIPPLQIMDTSETINTPGLENKIVSWLDGKWVVKSVQYNQKEKSKASTSLTLIRPTFIYSSDYTTIDKPDRFYQI